MKVGFIVSWRFFHQVFNVTEICLQRQKYSPSLFLTRANASICTEPDRKSDNLPKSIWATDEGRKNERETFYFLIFFIMHFRKKVEMSRQLAGVWTLLHARVVFRSEQTKFSARSL